MKTIAFFGHSQILNTNEIRKRILKTLKEVIPQGYTRLLIGCHGDFDNLALSTCVEFRNNYNQNIKINVVLTNLSYLNKTEFGYSKINFYKEINCDTFFYDIEKLHYKNRIIFSNKKMVEDSDLIICYVDNNSYRSGAKKAVQYAIKQNKKIINLFEEKDKSFICF